MASKQKASADAILFTIERNSLLPALASVNRVVDKRNKIPILSNVLLQFDDGYLSVVGTNLDIEAKARAQQSDIPDFPAFTVSSALLHSAVSKFSEGCEIEFSCNRDVVSLKAGRSRIQLPILPAEDFPVLGDDEFTHQFSLPSRELSRILTTVSFAISTEETRYYLNGVFMHRIDEYLALAATDGYQLASLKISAPDGSEGMPDIIIPRASLAPILHCAKADGDATIYLSDRKIRVAFHDGTTVTSKLVEGTFPEYLRIIPTTNDKFYSVDREALLSAVGRASLMADDKSNAVKLNFTGDDVRLEMSNPTAGNMEELVSLTESHPEETHISLNYKYCANALNATDAAEIRFALQSPADPCLLSPVMESGTPPLFIIMPIRR